MMAMQWSRPEAARDLARRFAELVPNSHLLPEVRLLVARSYELQSDWGKALEQYDDWLQQYQENTNHALAEYSRAMCLWHAGNATNALNAFNRFVADHPADRLTPFALRWIAEEHLRAARPVQAEASYKGIFESTNWPVSELTWWARLGAGRAAFARLAYREAREHFLGLVNDVAVITNPPPSPELVAKTYLLLGDTILEQYYENPGQTELWGAALSALQTVAENFSTNRLAAHAWGRIGAARFQHPSQDPAYLQQAVDAWQRVIDLEANNRKVADVSLRSQAEVAIGLALEKLAARQTGKEREDLLKQAQDRYDNVVYRAGHLAGESPDPYWYSQAVLESARLAEQRGNAHYAANLYREAIRQFPSLRTQIEPLLAKVNARAREDEK
jgi:tetratricopeptide (TPR) repeat protein